MKPVAGLVAVLMLVSTSRSSPDGPSPTWVSIGRLCGQMDYRSAGPDGGEAKPLSGVHLEIYGWKENLACCDESQLRWKTVTHRDGSYKFSRVRAGRYWLVARWHGKLFRLPVQFAPTKPTKGDCYLQGLEIDSEGNLKSWLRAVM